MQRRSKHKVNVLLLEPNPLAGRYLCELLKRQRAFRVNYCSNDFLGPHLNTQMSKELIASVLVIDLEALRSPLMNVLASIRSGHEMYVLLLGPPLGDDDICRLLFLGIHGFVSFGEVEEKLISAIEAVLQGRIWVRSDLLHRFAHFASIFQRNKRTGFLSFTAREQAISELLHQRLSNKEIASALGISERTVKFHVANIFAKAGVHDRRSVCNLLPHFKTGPSIMGFPPRHGVA